MNKRIIITASVLGMLAVIAGAFGAHALKAVLQPGQLQTWHTAVEYHFYHVFALLFLAVFARNGGKYVTAAYYLFTLGVVFFSGSLYLLSCRDTLGWNWLAIMGPVTPIGGLLFIMGWFTLLLAALKQK